MPRRRDRPRRLVAASLAVAALAALAAGCGSPDAGSTQQTADQKRAELASQRPSPSEVTDSACRHLPRVDSRLGPVERRARRGTGTAADSLLITTSLGELNKLLSPPGLDPTLAEAMSHLALAYSQTQRAIMSGNATGGQRTASAARAAYRVVHQACRARPE